MPAYAIIPVSLQATQQAARGENRKALRKTGDPTTFLIDRNQQRRMGAAGLQAVGQVDHLLDGFKISREENNPPGLYSLMNEARSGVNDVPETRP